MANQFSVTPLGGFNLGQGLRNLHTDINQRQMQQEQKSIQSEMMELSGRAARGDQEAVLQLYERNPKIAEMFEVRNRENKLRLGEQRAMQVKKSTGDFLAQYKGADDEQRQLLLQKAISDPNIDFDQEDADTVASGNEAVLDLGLINSIGIDSYKQLYGKSTNQTANQKDFSTYKQLKKSSPEDAEVFGRKAGFVEDANKRLFKISDGVKYFSDGTEEVVTQNEKIKSPDMKRSLSVQQATKIVDKAKEGQLKNAGFALTLNDGLATTDKMVGDGYDPTSASWINKYLAGTTIGNLAMSEQDQVFVGSVEQMINAIARRETGAAITAFEKQDFFNRYMPVAGDKPARIKQKRNALERQFKSIRGQSGSVYDAIRTTQNFESSEQKPKQEESTTQSFVIENHPQFGNITEDDIATTMQETGMSREEILARLRGQ